MKNNKQANGQNNIDVWFEDLMKATVPRNFPDILLNLQYCSYFCTYKFMCSMQTKLIKVGNSFGIRLPKTLVNQYNLENSNLDLIASSEGILLKPSSNIPALSEWNNLFEQAKRKGFNNEEDLKEFENWDITLQDGEKFL